MPALLLALFVAANPASPEETLAEAERVYAEGLYEQVHRLLSSALSGDLKKEDRVRALGLSGLTHAAFDDSKAAVDAFGKALDLDPAWEPTGRISPKVRGLFEEARKDRKRPAFLPPPVVTEPPPPTSTPEVAAESPSLLSRPWFWIAASVVVIGGAATGVVLAQPKLPASELPPGTLR